MNTFDEFISPLLHVCLNVSQILIRSPISKLAYKFCDFSVAIGQLISIEFLLLLHTYNCQKNVIINLNEVNPSWWELMQIIWQSLKLFADLLGDSEPWLILDIAYGKEGKDGGLLWKDGSKIENQFVYSGNFKNVEDVVVVCSSVFIFNTSCYSHAFACFEHRFTTKNSDKRICYIVENDFFAVVKNY